MYLEEEINDVDSDDLPLGALLAALMVGAVIWGVGIFAVCFLWKAL